jgi:hypothetical protein
LLSLPDRTRTTTTTGTIRNNPAASLSSCSIAFPAGQTEDDDDHDDDQGITSLPIIVLWSESFIRRFCAATSPAYYQPQKPGPPGDFFREVVPSGLPIAIRHRVLINTIS